MILLKQERNMEGGTYQGYKYTVQDDSGITADVLAVPPREHSSATAHQRVAFAAMRRFLAERQEKLQAKAADVMAEVDEKKAAETAVEDLHPEGGEHAEDESTPRADVRPPLPTIGDKKAVIHLFMVENAIPFDEDDTKQELLDKITSHIGQ